MKRIISLFLTAALLCGLFLTAALAMPGQYGEPPEDGAAALTTEDDTPPPATDLSCYDGFTTRALQAGETLRKGIDVSHWQGTIDWKAVAESGIEFAFVRVAGRYAVSGGLYEDTAFARNIEGAQAQGIKVGVYIYSQAITEEEAVEEADYVLERIKGYTLELPVVYDFEYYSNTKGKNDGRLYHANLTDEARTALCNAFCQRVLEAKRIPMVYANKNMLTYDVNYKDLIAGVWVAHYNTKTDYAGDYDFWQCSDKVTVPGITGYADIDFWYDDGAFGRYSMSESGDILASSLPFKDVPAKRWSYDSVLYCYQNGIINGCSPITFEPESETTRGQVVTMLYRMAGSPTVTGVNPFKDLTEDYYKTPILWGKQQNVVKGYDATHFGPNDNITRQDFVVLLYRYIGSPEVTGNLEAYSDAGQVADYAVTAMVWATENGVMNGTSATTLSPLDNATREQIAALLARYLQQN